MNFDLTEEQQLLADSLKRYLVNEYSIDTRAKIVDSPTGWSEKVWAAFAEMGLLGVPFAEEHGGFGGTAVDVMLVMEALGEGLVVEPYWVDVGLGGRLIARGGSDAQQKRICPSSSRASTAWPSPTPSAPHATISPTSARGPSAAGAATP